MLVYFDGVFLVIEFGHNDLVIYELFQKSFRHISTAKNLNKAMEIIGELV